MLKVILDFVAKVSTPGAVFVIAFSVIVLTLAENHRFTVVDKIVSLLFGNYLLYGIMVGMAFVIWHLYSQPNAIIESLEKENRRLINENKKFKDDLRAYTRKTLDMPEQKDE